MVCKTCNSDMACENRLFALAGLLSAFPGHNISWGFWSCSPISWGHHGYYPASTWNGLADVATGPRRRCKPRVTMRWTEESDFSILQDLGWHSFFTMFFSFWSHVALKIPKKEPTETILVEGWHGPFQSSAEKVCRKKQTHTHTPYIPQIWKDGWMLMLGKPNKPATTPYNLRPIALQDPVGKAIIGLLIRQACDDAKPTMLIWPLWAYMQQRSTLDAVCRVAHHCHQVNQLVASQKPSPHARASGIPKFCFCGGVSVMLDLERAFDSVSRAKLFNQLHLLQIRPEVIQLLTHWHIDTQYHFQHGCDSIALPTSAGLRQGCKAAPGLWNCLIVLYLQQVSQLLPITWLRHHLNIYADDYQVGGVYYSVADLQRLLQAFGILMETLTMFDLRINPKKSAALFAVAGTSHRKPRAQFVVHKNDSELLRIPLSTGDEIHIPIQSTVTYLGTQMTYKDCQTATLKHRICLARISESPKDSSCGAQRYILFSPMDSFPQVLARQASRFCRKNYTKCYDR